MSAGLLATTSTPRQDAREYLAAVLPVLEQGIYAEGEQWHDVLRAASREATDAVEPRDVYRILAILTRTAGGHHSHFEPPTAGGFIAAFGTSASEFVAPTVRVEDGIGIVTVPAITALDQRLFATYVHDAVAGIMTHQDEVTRGWIIDLTANTGGGFAPMLLALSPLLNNADLLEVAYPDGEVDRVTKRSLREYLVWNGDPYTSGLVDLHVDHALPIAVLQSGFTASAAEGTLFALMAQPNTRSFGQPTGGFTTANDTVPLPDGAFIVISTGYMRAPHSIAHDAPITPDVTTVRGDEVREAAEWLQHKGAR
ncbi:hypothetical protein GB882_01305 [Georgenia ruanii]|uniref:Tail specific protease domain-containing protein n=1 Tax=Georgenia ruanii TaxID=348442 RepID=A0A7J9URP8_9MICO|nr:hypothetical protein [Georgenia ruanii]